EGSASNAESDPSPALAPLGHPLPQGERVMVPAGRQRPDAAPESGGGAPVMRFGIWTPLPHTTRPEPRMGRAIAALKGGPAEGASDASFEFAVDVLRRGEHHGFDVTLIATRELGPDLEAWTTAAALAGHTRSIELMVAVHPGILTPPMAAKMGASL